MIYGIDLKHKKLLYLFIIQLIILVSNINCDLPIQCVKHQIIGQWKIQTNKGFKNSDGLVRCGHSLPDNPTTSYNVYSNKFKVKYFLRNTHITFSIQYSVKLFSYIYQSHDEVIVDLLENGQVLLSSKNQKQKVVLNQFLIFFQSNPNNFYSDLQNQLNSFIFFKTNQGTWTMMYDEGFSIDVENKNYFAFFKYAPIKEEEISEDVFIENIIMTTRSKLTKYEYDCTETIIGWFNDYNKNIKGCMKAFKINPQEENKHLTSESKGFVIQPLDLDINNFKIQEQDELGNNMNDSIVDQTQGFPKKRKSFLQNTLNDIILDLDSESYSSQLKSSPLNRNKILKKEKISEEDKLQNQNQHNERIQQLNTLDKNWKAGISTSFKDLSLNQVNKKSGRTKRKSHIKQEIPHLDNLKKDYQRKSSADDYYMHFSINDISDLPKEFTWEEYIDPPYSQNDCGSCYIISTVSMLNARLKIKYGKDFSEKISMQHLLNCSFYSQGCEGGYPHQIDKFGKDYFMIPERLQPFKNEVQKCKYNKLSQLEDYFKITEYGFVGEQYGRGNEREMMLEIMKNGPIVANFKTNADFVYYQSGVYHSVRAADWIIKCQKEPEWRPVEHAVMCYGWGESEEDGKYWLMQNSWGEDWGEKGRFKIRRGTDESFIESSAEYAQVEYIKKNINATKND